MGLFRALERLAHRHVLFLDILAIVHTIYCLHFKYPCLYDVCSNYTSF